MKEYFTISEFASLRNVNINSLRYYEKIGVLFPSRTDNTTNYRYYSADQLPILDIILWCIDVGIPLKNLKLYLDYNCFMTQRIFEDGRKMALQKIEDIKLKLEKIEYILNCRELNRQYKNKQGTYVRKFSDRHFITEKWSEDLKNVQEMKDINSSLFLYAEQKKMSPISPFGVIIQFKNSQSTDSYICCEILRNYTDKNILTIPAGEFLCKQLQTPGWISISHLMELIQHEIPALTDNFSVVVTNMILDKYFLENSVCEMKIVKGLLL